MKYADETAFDCGDPPQFCTWAGCGNKAVQTRVEVSHNGHVYRKIASDVMDRNHKLAGAYTWVGWVGRCDNHYDQEQRAIGADWREQVMQEFWAQHPEFAVVPRDEQERKDILSMWKAYAGKASRDTAERRRLSQEAAKIAAAEQYRLERELLPHEHP